MFRNKSFSEPRAYEGGIKSIATALFLPLLQAEIQNPRLVCVLHSHTFHSMYNYPCRHTFSCEMYFYTNPTHRRQGKMIGRSVGNENTIRNDIKTCALLSRSSTYIYADICTVYGCNSMSFPTVCRWVR